MANKTIEFEQLQLSETKLIAKFQVETQGFMKYSEQMLRGLERFTDIWKDNKGTLEAHPAVMAAFNDSVQKLAAGYLKSGHINEYNDEERAFMRTNIVRFRDEVENHAQKVASEEVANAGKFSKAAAEFKKNSKAGNTASKTAPQEEPAAAEVAGPSNERVVNMTFNVSQGGTVFVNSGPESSWLQRVPKAETPGEIAKGGEKPQRGARVRKPR